jgi:hypothetical protein
MVRLQITGVSKSMGSITWKLVASVEPVDVIPESGTSFRYGLKGFDVVQHKKSAIFSDMFCMLFKDWRSKVEKINAAVLGSKAKTQQFTESEFLIGLAILVGAAEFAQRDCNLFSVKDNGMDEEIWASLCVVPHFEKYMSFYRWKEFQRFSLLFSWMKSGKIVIPVMNFWDSLMNLMIFINQN